MESFNLERLDLILLKKCNLHCIMCPLASTGYLKDGPVMPLSIVKRAYDEAQSESLVVLCGGEPLLRDDICDVFDIAGGGIARTELFTNAIHATDEIASSAKKNRIKVNVSLESMNPSAHEAIRGKGSFQPTINGIKRFQRNGNKVAAAMVLQKENIEGLPQTIKALIGLGINEVVWYLAAYAPKRMSTADIRRLGEIAKEHSFVHKTLASYDPVLFENVRNQVFKENDLESGHCVESLLGPGTKCKALGQRLVIDPSGDYYPCICSFFNHDEERLGNAGRMSMKEVFNSSKYTKFRNRIESRQYYQFCKYCIDTVSS
jgi:radical SAM protein with 4Fe4S-binding SPASM domain